MLRTSTKCVEGYSAEKRIPGKRGAAVVDYAKDNWLEGLSSKYVECWKHSSVEKEQLEYPIMRIVFFCSLCKF